jgi:hypothetical protein
MTGVTVSLQFWRFGSRRARQSLAEQPAAPRDQHFHIFQVAKSKSTFPTRAATRGSPDLQNNSNSAAIGRIWLGSSPDLRFFKFPTRSPPPQRIFRVPITLRYHYHTVGRSLQISERLPVPSQCPLDADVWVSGRGGRSSDVVLTNYLSPIPSADLQ